MEGDTWQAKRDVAILNLMARAGLRVSEVVTLRLEDVELNQRKGHVLVRASKGLKERTVPLPKAAREALAAYLETHPERANPDAALWWGQRGPLKDRSAVLRILRKYALRAGINDFGPHTLRHTFATRYLAANPGDLRGLAALLGHASLNTVMVYTEPRLEDLAERLERVG